MTANNSHVVPWFFFDSPTTATSTLSLHDALPISRARPGGAGRGAASSGLDPELGLDRVEAPGELGGLERAAMRLEEDRKSTRLNSSHPSISYAVLCLKKKRDMKNFKFVVYECHFG